MAATEADSLFDRRGDEIILRDATARAHRGYIHAWIDKALTPTATMHHIIIERLDANGEPELIARRASKDNVELAPDAPLTYTQAAFQQVSQLQEALDKFGMACAKARVAFRMK